MFPGVGRRRRTFPTKVADFEKNLGPPAVHALRSSLSGKQVVPGPEGRQNIQVLGLSGVVFSSLFPNVSSTHADLLLCNLLEYYLPSLTYISEIAASRKTQSYDF